MRSMRSAGAGDGRATGYDTGASSARLPASRRSGDILEHVFGPSVPFVNYGRDPRRTPHRWNSPTVSPMSGPWDDAERAALVVLLRERPAKLSWPQIVAEVGERGSARAVLADAQPPDLFGDQQRPSVQQAARDIADWQARGLGLLTFLDDDYPAQLREIHEVPPLLFHRGRLVPRETAVSVVGSREASPEGLDIAASVAQWMSNERITVIAGLANGIDTAAHTAALEAGGRTVAIIGTGITKTYPGRESQAAGADRDRGPLAVAILAGCPAAPPELPDAQCGDVRLRTGDNRGRG